MLSHNTNQSIASATRKLALSLAWLPALLIIQPLNAAAHGTPRMFGKNAPFNTNDLPVASRLRNQLEWLPENARQQALKRLHQFNFPESDAQHLNVTADGHVFYSDPAPEPKLEAAPQLLMMQSAPLSLEALPAIDVFRLHSRPNSNNRVFLDFDGMTITGTQWNIELLKSTLNAKPFDLDNNPTNFNTIERKAIAEIWHRIAEDYAPFDIDITTEEPDQFTRTTGRVLFTRSKDANGISMPASTSGGVAFADVWGLTSYVSDYSPAFVYYNNLADGEPNSMAEAGAHEFGHNFGLSHDGTLDTGYFHGMGSGFVSWAPIMGVGYDSHVTQWSKGEYTNANNKEDDVAIIGGQLGFRPDDHGNTINNASPLLLDSYGKISVTTPETDPGNTEADNKGVIETRADVDMFYFDTNGGSVTILLEPAWTAFYRNEQRGANLDIQAILYNAGGTMIKTDNPNNETKALINTTLTAGRYYLSVEGVGNDITPYSDYNSMGEYFISGSITNPDITPPSPNPMTWANLPSLLSATSISMTASTATDKVSAVQYRFLCTFGGTGCANSFWQSSPTFVVSNLGAGAFGFVVKARDASGNETAVSSEATVVMPKPDSLPPSPNPMSWANPPSLLSPNSITMTAATATDNASAVQYRFLCTYGGIGCINSDWQSSPTYVLTNLGTGLYRFAVKARDSLGNETGLSDEASVVTSTPVAINENASANEDSYIILNVLGNDIDSYGDKLTIARYTQGVNGKVTRKQGGLQYKPKKNYNGPDTFTYVVANKHGGSATASVTIDVLPVNDAPKAKSDIIKIVIGQSRDIQPELLSNDTDIDGDTLSISSTSYSGKKGTATINGTSLIYEAGLVTGTDRITYTVNDDHGGTSNAVATIKIIKP